MLTMALLYYYDSNQRLRTWQVEVEGEKYRVITGLDDGKKVISKWKTASPKNIGKKNETTGEQQARIEAEALYTINYNKGWASTPNDVSMPFTSPMLANVYQKYKRLLDFTQAVFTQPKLDGFRSIITSTDIKSRDGKPIFNTSHVLGILTPLLEANENVVVALDGEMYNHVLKDDFNKISSLLRRETVTEEFAKQAIELVQFHCYDVIFKDTSIPYKQRFEWLKANLPVGPSIRLVPTTEVADTEGIDKMKTLYDSMGYEGAIIRLNRPYEIDKRTWSLMKYKGKYDAEFEIVEILEGNGNWSGCAKSVKIKLPGGETQDSGLRGTEAENKLLLAEKELWPGRTCTIEYEGVTPAGKLRFPIVTKFYKPGDPEQREPSTKI